MKLTKALKLKNKLAGEVTYLKQLLRTQNSRPSKQQFDYDIHEVLRKLREATDRLVQVKTAVAAANVEVYEKVFRLAELKGLVTTLREVEANEGTQVERSAYGTPLEIEYRAQLKKAELDDLAAQAETEIAVLQDALDEFNAVRSIDLSFTA
jgi:hypothetical protein